MNRQTLLSLSGWALAGALILCGANGPSDLRVRRLLIEDEDGEVKIELGTDRGRPEITLKGAGGETRLRLCVTRDDCPLVTMSKAGSKAGMMFGIAKNGWPVASSEVNDGTPYRFVTERRR